MFKKILVPLDGSQMGEAVFPIVRQLAEQNGSQVIFIHVNEPMDIQYYGPEMMMASPEFEHTMRAEANTYLQRTLASWEERGFKATVVLTDAVKAPEAIVAYADANAVDLITMSTHGRSGIGRMLMGSVTGNVVHHAKIPVLLVHPDETQP